MVHKDIRKVIKAIEADSRFYVVMSTQQHARVYASTTGEFLTQLPGTPSDWRSLANSLRPLLQRGFQWPPAPKKIRRTGRQ